MAMYDNKLHIYIYIYIYTNNSLAINYLPTNPLHTDVINKPKLFLTIFLIEDIQPLYIYTNSLY